MPVFSLAKTFFTPLTAARTFINIGMRSMSSISSDAVKMFTRKILQEPLAFQKRKPSGSGIRYVASYGDVPIIIRVNADFPAVPLYTVFAKLTNEQNKITRKALFTFDDESQLPENWQIPDRQPKPDKNFHSPK